MRKRIQRWAGMALSAALLTGVAACDVDDILEVTDPDIVTPDKLTGPTGLATLRAGAIGDFAFALAGNAGGTEGQILISGMMSDEYIHSGTFTTRREFDRRDVDESNGTAGGVFSNLQRARQALETAARTIEESVEAPTADKRIGELRGLAGFTYVMFGENYCSGVPYSDLEGGQIVPGQPTTTAETFQRAVDRFDAAIQNAAGDAAVENMARIGKARALVNLGQYAEAAQVVASVPTDFEWLVDYSTNTGGQENGVYNFNVVFERWSLANNEGQNGLTYRDYDDPRVPWVRTGGGTDLGFDEVTPQYDMLKFPGRDAPITLATGEEARLIEAEAALAADQPGVMIDKINEVRERYDLDPVTDPGTEAGRVDLLFRERAITLFATSHRLGDMRRLARQYGRAVEDVFPTGAYFKGGSYGTDVNFPVPFQERNNENFEGCLDRNP